VLFHIHSELGRARENAFAVNAAGEGVVFHFFLDRPGLDLGQRFSRLDQGAGGDEAGQFVTGEQGFFQA
jgi:hypothetical protein